VQVPGTGHDTPDRPLSYAFSAGAGCTVQWLPFQTSSSISVAPLLKNSLPAAVQDRAEVHETSLSWPPAAGLGVGVTVQRWPFQVSASARWLPGPRSETPTAVQASGDGQDTWEIWLTAAPAGLGVA